MSESPEHLDVDDVCQQYVDLWRSGNAPSIEEYAKKHPELSQQIRDLLPTMIFAEQLNPRIETESSKEIEVPGNLGPFAIHREIGRGGMGVVYEASQAELSQPIALKVLHNFGFGSPSQSDRFIREAEAAARLHHANIVPPRQYGTTDSYHYLAMALIDGVSLDRLIRGEEVFADDDPILGVYGKLVSSPQQIAILGAQVASALSHAHENGMVHRDIKPANLILDRNGEVWVTDFGLAKLFDEDDGLSRTGELIGTPRYMAPEQLVGIADERTDIYGIGVTLYELVAKRRPWAEHRRNAGDSSILDVPDIREFAPEIPEELACIIMQACQHHPESRYASARALEFALNNFAYRGDTNRRSENRNQSQIPFPFATVIIAVAAVIMAGWLISSFFLESKDESVFSPQVSSGVDECEQVYAPPKTNCISYIDPETKYHHVVVKICERSDDAEEYGEGTMYLDSSDLELTWDEEYQLVGLRFPGVKIPKDATIHSAKISFHCYSTDDRECSLRITGIDDANPVSFRPIPYDMTNRPRTETTVQWQPGPWERDGIAETSDCKAIVQTIVSKADWKSGNALGFIIDGEGSRRAGAYDDNIHSAAFLSIQFEPLVIQ